MTGLIKTTFRLTLLAVLAGGAAFLVAGPERAGALVHQAHDNLVSIIDDTIDDPVALRAQLRELEAEYPQRISEVRGDLAELNEQIRQLDREKAVAERVVALADRDLDTLQPLLAKAEGERGMGGAVLVSFGNRSFTINQAYTRANQIGQTRIAYGNRAADAGHDLEYLRQQAARLEEILLQLETERTQFQAQIWQLERQVDAIARNDRLIEIMEERKRTIDEYSRFEVASLDQLHGRLAEVRSRQEAELEYLASDQQRLTYEEMAEMQLDTETRESLDAEAVPSKGGDIRFEGPVLRTELAAGR